VAQETSLIKELTLHVINEVGRQWRAWADEGRRLPIAVNLSTRDLVDPGFRERLRRLARQVADARHDAQVRSHESSVLDDPKGRGRARAPRRYGATVLGRRLRHRLFLLAHLKRLPIERSRSTGRSCQPCRHEEDEVIVRSTIDSAITSA